MVKLSAKQRASLYNAVRATEKGEWIDPFLSGSTTISTLKKHGFIAAIKDGSRTVYQATDAGREWFGYPAVNAGVL